MPLPPEDGMGLSEAEVTTLLSSADENVLTTALSRAIAVEDFGLAAKLSARLKEIQGVGDCAAAEKPTNTEDTDGEVIVEGVGTRGDVAGSVMGEGRTAALAPSLVPPPVSTTMPPAPGRAVSVPT